MNIIFLNPYLILGTLFAAIPVVLHLISRQKSRRIPFSALFLLRRVDVKTAQRHKLVDILLLLLRTILILLLILALAKPVWRPKGAVSGATGDAIRVTILDDSFSAGLVFKEKSLFENERNFAESAIKTMQPGDTGILITTSGGQWPKSLSPTRNSTLLLNALDKLKPSCSSKGLISSLNRIIPFLEEAKKSVAEIIIITDRQKHSFAGSLETAQLLKLQPNIYLCPVEAPENNENLTLSQSTVQTSLPFPGFPVYIEYQILNHSSKPGDTTIRLWNDENILEEKNLSIKGSSSYSGNFTFTPLSAEFRSGKIDMKPDSLPVDNAFYFHWHLVNQVKILIVSNAGVDSMEKDGSLFLAAALEPFDNAGKKHFSYHVENTTFDRIANFNLREYALVFLLNIFKWEESTVSSIGEYVRSGGAAFFFHGSPPLDAGSLESPTFLKTIIPFRLERIRSNNDAEQPDSIGECDPDHPIIKSLKKIPRLDFSSVHFYKIWNIRIPPEGAPFNILMKTKNSAPVFIEDNIGKGRLLYFLSGLDPDAGDLGTRPFFIPFLFETIKYLLSDTGGKYGIAGEPITLEYDDSNGEKAAYEIITPEHKKIKIDWESDSLVFTNTEMPGTYRYKPATETRDQEQLFSINVDPREGDLTRISLQEIGKIFPDSFPVSICKSPLELEKTLKRNRSGKPLSFHLFLAAFIVFLLEILLANLLLVRREKEPRKDL